MPGLSASSSRPTRGSAAGPPGTAFQSQFRRACHQRQFTGEHLLHAPHLASDALQHRVIPDTIEQSLIVFRLLRCIWAILAPTLCHACQPAQPVGKHVPRPWPQTHCLCKGCVVAKSRPPDNTVRWRKIHISQPRRTGTSIRTLRGLIRLRGVKQRRVQHLIQREKAIFHSKPPIRKEEKQGKCPAFPFSPSIRFS